MHKTFFWTKWLICYICATSLVNCYMTFQTKSGFVRGTYMLSRNGKKFGAFIGIPYAEPPVGKLRFHDPLPKKPWNGTLDCTKYSSVCPQLGPKGFIGKEDCLRLNIFTPKLQNTDPIENLPVWVFIYGGRRISGHALPYKHGPHYIMDKPVIFITFNYRIGPLGFLSTEDSVISGNYGIKDELTVLNWVQDNARYFGGDPSNVTVSGGSTGGIDTCLLLSSPLSKGLFHRAISQSGHCLKSVIQRGIARTQSWRLAKEVGCTNIIKTEQLLTCLQSVPVERLFEIIGRSMIPHPNMVPYSFNPVIESKDVENRLITENPYSRLQISRSIPWLMGFNSDEGGVVTAGIYSSTSTLRMYSRHMKKLAALFFNYNNLPNKDNITAAIMKRYLKNGRLEDSFYEISKIFGIAQFAGGVMFQAAIYNGLRYLYMYDHINKINYMRNYFLRGIYAKYKLGSVHGEELRSLQHYPSLFPPIIDGEDRIVSEQVLSMWFNFVSTGNPNPKDNEIWKSVSSTDLEYLHINNLTLTMKSRPLWEEFTFWRDLGFPSFNLDVD